MNEAFQTWFEKRGRLPGVLSCGVRFPNQECLSRCNTQSLPEEKLLQVWQHMADALKEISRQTFPAKRWLWTYAEGQLHGVLRPDGILLFLVASTRSQNCNPIMVEKIIEEFLQL